MYDKMAKCMSSHPSINFVRLFLTVCTNLSTCPLDCAFVCDATLCSICNFLWSLGTLTRWIECHHLGMHLGTPISVKISFRIWLHSLSGDSAVFTQPGTSWSNQLLVNTVCLSMGRCLNQVVPIWSLVFLQTAGSLFAESLQTCRNAAFVICSLDVLTGYRPIDCLSIPEVHFISCIVSHM